MSQHEKINYIELPAKDLNLAKQFFSQVFAWEFIDYGPEYSAFTQASAGIDGGFYLADLQCQTAQGSALVVLYSEDLEQTQAKIEPAGGAIVRPIFSFPGGRRFHFTDPNGNEYAVWSDQGISDESAE
jgi:predicted enzyme related to lactoylglutathione lyase